MTAADARKLRDTIDATLKAKGIEPANDSPLTEDTAALRFTARHKDVLRYCHTAGIWLRWNGAIWAADGRHVAFHWARETARKAAHEVMTDDRGIVAAGKAAFANGVERFARHDPAHARTGEVWDRDPFKLGTPGGTVDLRTGALRAADPADEITKAAAVTPAAMAGCPIWRNFLLQVCGGDAGLVRFLQQWTGYCLTGDTQEHALFFAYGPGGNGKSVFLNTVFGILGGYASTAAMDTFTVSRSNRHSTELAMLRGARLVTASETEEGRTWAEAKIKQMTGGDPITARLMRQDNSTFRPQFKLMIVGNHKPRLSSVDEAAKRRFNIVPFTYTPVAPDRELEARLKVEWPAILRWMIDGCRDWQMHGLLRPAVVANATASYFAEQDVFGQWLEDTCDVEPGNPHKWETSAKLFASWTDYGKAAGEESGTAKTFSANMQARGLEKWKASKGVRVYRGVCFRAGVAGGA